jgi:hypothetical protein
MVIIKTANNSLKPNRSRPSEKRPSGWRRRTGRAGSALYEKCIAIGQPSAVGLAQPLEQI